MLCKDCGRSVAEDAKVCAHCGRELRALPVETEVTQTLEPPQKQKKRPRRWLWAIVPAAGVVLLGLLLLGKSGIVGTKTVYLLTKTVNYSFQGTPNQTTALVYDSQGRLERFETPGRHSVTDAPVDCRVSYTYDGDRLVGAHIRDDAMAFDLTYRYKNGQLDKVQSVKDTETGAQIKASCNKKGQITRLYYYFSKDIYRKYSYTYHEGGQLASVAAEYPGSMKYIMRSRYDTHGNLTEYVMEADGQLQNRVVYEYDSQDRLISQKEYSPSQSPKAIYTLGLSYTTDKAGLLTAIRIHQTQEGGLPVQLTLAGTPQDRRVELRPVSGDARIPDDLCITVAWDKAGNVVEEKVVVDGIYRHYKTYEYTPMVVPGNYKAPALIDPKWFLDI